jgi:hypothetical protein
MTKSLIPPSEYAHFLEEIQGDVRSALEQFERTLRITT